MFVRVHEPRAVITSTMALALTVSLLSACASSTGRAPNGFPQRMMVSRSPGEPAGGPDRTGSGEPTLDIRLDFEVVERFLDLVERIDALDEELDRWVSLPGNRELLRRGRNQEGASPERLRAAAAAAIRGELLARPGLVGRLDIGPWDLLRGMVDSIQSRRSKLVARASNALADYLPDSRPDFPFMVYFHLGGSWDGRSSDHVYINLSFFHSRGMESLPGLDALLVHELFHQVQARTLGSVDDYSSRHSALFTLMLRIQQEGIARHLEYRYLQEQFPESALDRTNFWKYDDGLRHASEHAAIMGTILEELERGRRDEVRSLSNTGFALGGPLYAVGHDMAVTIETTLGRAALAETVAEGPIAFFEAYWRASHDGGPESILPPGLETEVAAVKRGYAKSWRQSSRLRREGLRLLQRERLDEAIEVLERAVSLDQTDAISAYNLACSYALAGEKSRSLRWLERALERGFDDYKHVAVDPDLVSLHDAPEFGRLLRSRGFKFQLNRGRKGEATPVNP